MNATSLEELRAGSGTDALEDEKMEQVRQLLFGDHQREVHARIGTLEQRQRDFEATVTRQLDALTARIEALAAEAEAGRRSAFDELSHNVLELGERIRTLSGK